MDVSGSIRYHGGVVIIKQMIAFIADFYDNFNIENSEENFIPISIAAFSDDVDLFPNFQNLERHNRDKNKVIEQIMNTPIGPR